MSRTWGKDRGTPVDRYYIERFLREHRTDIRGHVLEVKDGRYTERFGDGVTRIDVVDIDPHNPAATIVADLTAATAIAANTFDCFILTQTLQFIFDVPAAVAEAHRILRPGGVLLATVPCVSRNESAAGPGADQWRFTTAGCTRLFESTFGKGAEIRARGNVLTAVAFLMGVALEELSPSELDVDDDLVPLLVTIRAVKA